MNKQLQERLEEIARCGLPITRSKGEMIHPTNQIIGWVGECPEYVSQHMGDLSRVDGLDLSSIWGSTGHASFGSLTQESHPRTYNSLCRAMGYAPETKRFHRRHDLDLHQWYDKENNETFTALMPSLRFVRALSSS